MTGPLPQMLTVAANTSVAILPPTVGGAPARRDDGAFADLLALMTLPGDGGETEKGSEPSPDSAARDGQDDAEPGKDLPDAVAVLPGTPLVLPIAVTALPPTPAAVRSPQAPAESALIPQTPARLPIEGRPDVFLPKQEPRDTKDDAYAAALPLSQEPGSDRPVNTPTALSSAPVPTGAQPLPNAVAAPAQPVANDLSITEAITAVAETVARSVVAARPADASTKPPVAPPVIVPVPSRFAPTVTADAALAQPVSRAALAGSTSPAALSIATAPERPDLAACPAAPVAAMPADDRGSAEPAPVATAAAATITVPATGQADPARPLPAIAAGQSAPTPSPRPDAPVGTIPTTAAASVTSVLTTPVPSEPTATGAATPTTPAPSEQLAPRPGATTDRAPATVAAPPSPAVPIDPRVGAPVIQATIRPATTSPVRQTTIVTPAADDDTPGITAFQPAIATAPAALTAPEAAAPLDMTRPQWPTAMIERIEQVRDALDAVDTRIRLAPDALGSIDLSVKTDGDTVHVHFNADQAATRAMIADAQPRLAEIAEQRGLKLGQTSVSGDTGGAAQQWGDQRRQPQQQSPSAPSRPASARSAADEAGPTRDDARIA